MRHTFFLNKELGENDWWKVTVKDYEGIELHFRYQMFNSTKQLDIANDVDLSHDALETLVSQMIRWLMVNYYDIVCDETMPIYDQMVARQFAMAMEYAELDNNALAEQLHCKATRIKHIKEGRYTAMTLDMFLKALDAMGFGLSIYPK